MRKYKSGTTVYGRPFARWMPSRVRLTWKSLVSSPTNFFFFFLLRLHLVCVCVLCVLLTLQRKNQLISLSPTHTHTIFSSCVIVIVFILSLSPHFDITNARSFGNNDAFLFLYSPFVSFRSIYLRLLFFSSPHSP